jgi:hypothetical protein
VSAIEPPKFHTPSLDALAAAFGHRGKAIRYHGNLSVARETDGDHERLNVDYSGSVQLRLSVWSTGDWWFLACKRQPRRAGGWMFKHELRGELGHRPSEALVKSFEDSRLVGYYSPDEQLAKLQQLWHGSRRSAEA